eukprot:6949901-Alexandrium_andersonii.AAC.1
MQSLLLARHCATTESGPAEKAITKDSWSGRPASPMGPLMGPPIGVMSNRGRARGGSSNIRGAVGGTWNAGPSMA